MDTHEPTQQHGHPFFYEQTKAEEALHSAKNHDYAKGGRPLGNFERVATILSLYPGLDPAHPVVVAMTYMLKQLDAVLWGLAQRIEHKVEGLHPRLQDISVYAKLARCILQDQAQATTAVIPPAPPVADTCICEVDGQQADHNFGCPQRGVDDRPTRGSWLVHRYKPTDRA